MASYTQYSQYGGNPYGNAPNLEGGHGAQGNHLGQDQIGHEMTNMSTTSNYSNNAGPASSADPRGLTQKDFLDQVKYVKGQVLEVSKSIETIERLHDRDYSSVATSSSSQLEAVVSQTQVKISQIRDSIKYLESDAVKSNNSIKTTQVRQLKSDFKGALSQYQEEESNYKRKYREQIKRQYLIVNPDASDGEVNQAMEMDWADEGVFSTALRSSRSTQANSVFGAVRARHNELAQIEKTLTELAAMFQDMAQIVEAQEPIVQRTEENAIQTQEDVQKGNVEIDKANEHARRRNRLKWWLVLVVVLIILAVALGVGLGVGLAAKTTKTVTG